MKILFAAAEASPFIKIGGLGDVMYGLPKALAEQGEEVAVVLPLYKSIKERFSEKLSFITHFSVPLSWRQQYCGLFSCQVGAVTYYFLDNEYYYDRNHVYGSYDDGERFAYFAKAVLEMLHYTAWMPDIIHANDWQTALVPIFLKAFYQNIPSYGSVKTMFTIHNIEYQGQAPLSFREDVLGLSEAWLQTLAFGGCLNFMFSAICHADKVTTVSNTYAQELKTDYFGGEMAPVLRGVSYKFCGILNGLDQGVFNPRKDPALPQRYSANNPGGKAVCKQKFRESTGLYQDPEVPILAMVSRLVRHKGLDLLEHIRHELLERRLQLVVLGTGEEKYESMFRNLQAQYPGRVSVHLCFDQELASRIYAASDLFLMPSQSEPCGLSQLIAMRYGAIPVVHEIGGLKDTVWPVDPETGDGRGFTFQSYNAHDMLDAIDRSLWFYYEKKPELKKLILSNMETDFSWKRGAEAYLNLYHSM